MRTSKSAPALGQIGHLIPRLLLAVGLLDLGLRFIPVEPLTFRAWEALTRYRPPGAAFEPNRHYENDRAYGDIAAMGNLPEVRQYRREVFSTDAFGFRNAVHVATAAVSTILIGDSFAVGSGVSDDETLSAQLTALSGCPVYNAASEEPNPDPDRIVSMARRLGMPRGLVIHLYSEDRDLPRIPASRKRRVTAVLASMPPSLAGFVGWVRGLATVSPLQIGSERVMKAIEDGKILPNSYAGRVVRRTLENGDPILFRAAHVEDFYTRRPASADYWTWLAAELRDARLDLLVLLVPGKYTVYRPHLIDDERRGNGGGDYLDRLEGELRPAGIPVLNLTPVFRARAADALRHGQYLYWRDDIHWNADGIALAALAVRSRATRSAGDCRRLMAEKP